MKFRSEFDIKKLPQPITHYHKTLLIGSCFTENMGGKLDNYKFTTLQNPNGILFNPVSVAEALTSYIENTLVTENDLFQWQESWHSWKHHSRFSGISASDAVNKINASTTTANNFLKQADYVFITLGSAWTYILTEKAINAKLNSVAANNHKAPTDWFCKKLMTTDEVLQVLDNIIHRLFLFNYKVKIIFTISPVRHLREGVVENNRSKAALIQAVHQLVDKFDRLYYFPAYELVIDDLRDYRFYAEDLVHPNYIATEYVWGKFLDACTHEETKKLVQDIHAINLAFKHKPFNEETEAHKNFKLKYLKMASAMQQRLPFLNLEREINYFAL